MTTENYFKSILGFQLTASDVNIIIAALNRYSIICADEDCEYFSKDLKCLSEKLQSQLDIYVNL